MRSGTADDIAQALRSCWSPLLWVLGFSLFVNALMLVPAFYMLQVYDRVITTGSRETLLVLTLVALFLMAVMGLLDVIRSRLLVRVGNGLDARLGARLHRTLFALHLRRGRPASVQPLEDLRSLRQFLSGHGLFAFFDAPWVPLYLALLFLFDPWLGAFASLAGLALLALTLINEKSTRWLLTEASDEHRQARARIEANLRNAEVAQTLGMIPALERRWLTRHQASLVKQSRASDRTNALTQFARTLRLASQSLILGLGALLVLEGRITPGVMIAASIILARTLAPIDGMIGGWRGFVSARDAYRRLTALGQEMPVERQRLSLPAPCGEVSLESVTMVPPGIEKPVLQDIDLRVAPGEHVGIIGPSGAGKSTLARLLVGAQLPRQGTVRLDGASLDQWNDDELGPCLGYLPQDIELFEGTVSENIARFGDVDDKRVVEAAHKAGVHEMILRLPEGYGTWIDSASGILSRGQRQRVALARALYGEPALVVLDEPNANLDDAGERALGAAMRQLKEAGTTLFVISHRRSVLDGIDTLLLIDEGCIRLRGPRDEVLSRLGAGKRRTAASAPNARQGTVQRAVQARQRGGQT
ncbi:MAG: type I secretion system permease/ATPase [Halomonas sp.]|nr:type I secretion system permease/ATPase [Halomonas sp.]